MTAQPECDICGDTGTMVWMQPAPGPDGAPTLVEMHHPCMCRRSDWWKMPAAERGTVIGGLPASNVADANRHHRTDWSRPGDRPSFGS